MPRHSLKKHEFPAEIAAPPNERREIKLRPHAVRRGEGGLRGVAGVPRHGRFKEDDVGLLVSDGPMFDTGRAGSPTILKRQCSEKAATFPRDSLFPSRGN
jgi:hypothetical protein